MLLVCLVNLVDHSESLNSGALASDSWRWPAAALCVALSYDPDDWLLILIILGSVGIAHSDSKESVSKVFFLLVNRSWEVIQADMFVFINSSYTVKSCPVW